MVDSTVHPLVKWMARQRPPLSQEEAAARLSCTKGYVSLVVNWKRSVSLKRAGAWSKITGLPIEAFLQPESMARAAE